MQRPLWIALLLLASCQGGSPLSRQECEELSLKAYKGFPQALNTFNKRCQNVEITYTKEHCQKAFKDLVLDGRPSALKNKYGDRVLDCFSEKEKGKFLRE